MNRFQVFTGSGWLLTDRVGLERWYAESAARWRAQPTTNRGSAERNEAQARIVETRKQR